MRSFAVALLLFVSLAAQETPATAEAPENADPLPPRFTGYSSSRVNIRFDYQSTDAAIPDDYTDLSHELFVEGTYDRYTVGLRKNLLLFLGRGPDDKVKNFDYRYAPEAFNHGWMHALDRIYLKMNWPVVTVTAGDVHESMNRGLFFSLLKDPAGEDNAVRGGSVTVRSGDLHAKAFGGVANPLLRDRATLERTGEANDILWGTEAGYRIAGMVDTGVEYGGGLYGDYTLDYQRWDDPSSPRTYQSKYFHIVGLYADAYRLIPRTTVYLGGTLLPAGADRWTREAAWGDTRKRTDLTLANALYFSIINWHDIDKSRLTITVEGKRYERYWLNYRRMEDLDFSRRYFKPPALMWENLPLLNDLNTMGLRTRVQFTDRNLTGLTAAAEFIGGLSNPYRDRWEYEEDLSLKEDYWFAGGSLERRFDPVTINAKTGYLKVNGPSNGDYHGETLYVQLLTGLGVAGFSAKLNLELYRRDLTLHKTPEEQGAIEQRHVLDLSWRNMIFASYVGTYYRNVFSKGFVEKDLDEYYPGGSVGFAYRDIRLSLFGGLMRGGLTCLGGVCRYLPDFKGIKMELEVKL